MAHGTAHVQEKLEEELARVTEELTSLGIHNPENPADWIATPEASSAEADPNVVADKVEDWDERRATLATLEGRYNDLVRALAKITAGTYGTCEVGGETISKERLEANPAARTCLAHLDDDSSSR